MEKSIEKAAVAVFLVAISVMFILSILFVSQMAAFTSPSTIKIPPESLGIAITPANIKLQNGYYNVSVPLVNTGASTALLRKFYVYPSEGTFPLNRTIPDMTLYFNETAQNPNQLDYNLKSGDNLQVNFLITRPEYAPNTNMSLTVYTSQALYGSEFALNWIA